ncbi:MAG: hypothetical protein MI717_10640 [Spirochaetales bacterium]|nr:hypothetical protein [Spirochaetales bacterium]
MKINWKKPVALFSIFIASFGFIFALVQWTGKTSLAPLVEILIVAGVLTLWAGVFALWAFRPQKGLDGYAGYPLEELDLGEDELNDAVANWVFAHYRKRVEGEIRFLEDEDGGVSCRATVRKEP